MSDEAWPLHHPIAVHVVAFDIVGFSRNLHDPAGLLQDRHALFRSVEETTLIAKCAPGDFFAQFLGDELRIAFRNKSLATSMEVIAFAESVHRNLERISGGAPGTSVRAAVLTGTAIARESMGCRYLAGPVVETVQAWMGSGAIGGGQVAANIAVPGWTSAPALGADAHLASITAVQGTPDAAPVDESCPADGKHCFIVAIGSRSTKREEARAEELVTLVSEGMEAAQVNVGRARVSIAGTSAMVALEDDTADRARALLGAIKGGAVRRSAAICAVITKGPLLAVKRPWISSNFEGGPAIVAARVMAKLESGSLAVCGKDLEYFYPDAGKLPTLSVPGKRGETFSARVDANFFWRGDAKIEAPELASNPRVAAARADPRRDELALFDIYSAECEPHYVSREVDDLLMRALGHTGVWLSGPAGTGKTTCVRRGLLRAGRTFAYLGFANCQGGTVEQILAHAFLELAEIVDSTQMTPVPKGVTELSSRITRLLVKAPFDYLYIDELPTDDLRVHSDVTKALSGLVTAHASLNPQSPLRFVVTSIHSAVEHVGATQQVVLERVAFLRLTPWSEADVARLLQSIIEALGMELPVTDQALIVKAAKGSPRLVKNCIRKLRGVGRGGEWTVSRAIDESSKELGL